MGRRKPKTYCRLCAEFKPLSELTNLETDKQKYEEIISKLRRLHLTVQLNDNIWPKTICSKCIDSLKQAFDFTAAVEQAQKALSSLILVHQVKGNESDSDYENNDCEAPNVSNEVNIEDTDVVDLTVVPEKDNSNSESEKEDSEDAPISLDEKEKDDDTDIPVKIKLTWKEYKWVCTYCNKRFRNVDQLRVHSLHYHNTCNAYQCIDCNTKKYHLDRFLQHVRTHRHYLKFSCYKCFMKLTTFQDMENHEAMHINSDYVCFGCNTNFSSSEEINKHVTMFYKDQQARELPVQHNDSLTCTLCNKTLTNKLSMDGHLLLHTERQRDHICDHCGKGFFHKRTLNQHIVVHSETSFQCEICKFSFKSMKGLRYHATVHTGERPYACEKCGKCFRVKKELTRHHLVHTDKLPFICSHCNKSFRSKELIVQHMRRHTGVKPYSCETCPRKFSHWSNYNCHMKKIHGTDMSKRVRTAYGLFKKDPATGEAIYPGKEKMQEWINKILAPSNTGRRRKNE